MVFKRIDSPKFANASMQPAFDRLFSQMKQPKWVMKGLARLLPLAEEEMDCLLPAASSLKRDKKGSNLAVFSVSRAFPRFGLLNESLVLPMPPHSNLRSMGKFLNEAYLLSCALHMLKDEKAKIALENRYSIPIIAGLSAISLSLYFKFSHSAATLMGSIATVMTIALRSKRFNYLNENLEQILSDFLSIASRKEEKEASTKQV